MSFQRVPYTAQIAVRYFHVGQPIVNLYYAQKPGGYDQSDLDGLAVSVDTNAASALLVDQSERLFYVKTEVVGLDQQNDLSAESSLSAGAGGQAGAPLPSFLAFCVSQRSDYSGRSARGRVYVPGIPPDARDYDAGDENYILSTYADAYVGHVDGFRQTIEALAFWDAVLVSRYTNGAKRNEGVVFRWTTTLWRSRQFATMRSRRIS